MTTTRTSSDPEVAARLRSTWELGDYARVADEIIPSLGPTLVEAAALAPGERVLDVAAGSGNASIPAARTGADVTANDITPALLDAGRRRAEGAPVRWEVGDAEALPYDDDTFDAVISCVGVMFAPRHERAADELVRVCRPGGRIALLSWTPSGFIGQLFATLKPFAPPPPPGASPAPLWGSPEHVAGLLGNRIDGMTTQTRTLTVDRFAEPSGFREYFGRYYGPTVGIYRRLADDAAATAELDSALDELAASHTRPGGADGRPVMEWEYLLLTATVR